MWSISRVADRYRVGFSTRQVAHQAGVSQATVMNMLNLAGVARRKQSRNTALEGRVVALYYDEQLSLRAVARRTGLSHTGVHKILKRIGFPRRIYSGRVRAPKWRSEGR